MDTLALLQPFAQEEYRVFSQKLIPGGLPLLGVRLPKLRELAGQIARREDWREIFSCPPQYMEQLLLRGMAIAKAKVPLKERLELIRDFVPLIDNWSVCDSFCSSLKCAAKEKRAFRDFLQPYLESEEEFPARFGAVMLLDYYIDSCEIDRTLQSLISIPAQGYYARMGVAWALSICLAKCPEQTKAWLQGAELDDFTFNKALQKAVESARMRPEDKAWARAVKRRSSSKDE
jgi:3-methyladenine DNA glycosylase AlkD